jgi:hypothetical protein
MSDTKTPIPVAVDPATGALITEGGGGGGSATVVGIGPLGFNSAAYDSLTYTATSSSVDTYKYYAGGTGGTLVATVTITYTDSTHSTLTSAVRT